MNEEIPETVSEKEALALTIHFFLDLRSKYENLEKENVELRRDKFKLIENSALNNVEIKELKARLAHVESEYAKECEVTEFYGDMGNWHDRSERTDGDYQDSILDDDELLREDQWQERQYVASKRARQRIKERKEFNNDNN